MELALSASYKPRSIKNDILIKMSDKIDLLKIVVRLAHETKSVSTEKYITLEQKIIEIGRITGGWIKSI